MRPSLARAWALILLLLVAGCLGDADTGDPGGQDPPVSPSQHLAFGEPVDVGIACTFSCFEPTVAVDPSGRIFVSEGTGPGLAVSTDGGATFEAIGTPEIPGFAVGAIQADNMVQIGPDGSLYFSALLQDENTLPVLLGIQVARSDDGGKTWPTNVVISTFEDPATGTVMPDRQWLGFGQDGVVYLSYSQVPTGLYIHRSQDRAATWSAAIPVATAAERGGIGQAGPPVVDSQGTVYLPNFVNTQPEVDDASGRAVTVAVSEDDGATWTRQVAFRAPEGAGVFPMLTVDGQDTVHLVAGSGEGLRVTRSQDQGATWSQPVAWSTSDPPAAPWIEVVGDDLTVSYFEARGQRVALHVASSQLDDDPAAGPSHKVTLARDLPIAGTDLASLAVGPAGPWIVWSDHDTDEILVAGPSP